MIGRKDCNLTYMQFKNEFGRLLPDFHLKRGEVRKTGEYPMRGNTNFDVWEGLYLNEEKVAIKIVRGFDGEENKEKTFRRFLREISIWRSLWEQDQLGTGDHILAFYGACNTDGPYPYVVSPWMANGNVLQYVLKHEYVDRRRLIRRIAEGIKLLHTHTPHPIIHGDIKAANILMDEKGKPLLADFGLSKIMETLTGVNMTQSRGISDSFRWFAPELCVSPGILSLSSDVYAYGMTVLELMTGKSPFAETRRTTEVIIKVREGKRPARPTEVEVGERGLDDKLWGLLVRCWDAKPANRPTIDEVLANL